MVSSPYELQSGTNLYPSPYNLLFEAGLERWNIQLSKSALRGRFFVMVQNLNRNASDNAFFTGGKRCPDPNTNHARKSSSRSQATSPMTVKMFWTLWRGSAEMVSLSSASVAARAFPTHWTGTRFPTISSPELVEKSIPSRASKSPATNLSLTSALCKTCSPLEGSWRL